LPLDQRRNRRSINCTPAPTPIARAERSRFAPACLRAAFAPRKRRLYRTLRSWRSQILANAAALIAALKRSPRRERRGNEEIFSAGEGASCNALILFSDQAT
jgi:hypothetical protein